MALVGPAHASGVVGPPPVVAADFGVIESPGVYTVFDNSTVWYIDAFSVSNPFFDSARTTQAGWAADVTFVSCGSGCGNYLNNYYNSPSPGTLATDIGPGQSSSLFTFSAPPASTYTIDLIDANGDVMTVSGPALPPGVPEPTGWALMIAGFGLAGAALRRRRRLTPQGA